MNRILATLISAGLACSVCAAEPPACDRELDRYLGQLAAAAYGSGSMRNQTDIAALMVWSKQNSADSGSCMVLEDVRQSAVARTLVSFLDGFDRRTKVRISESVAVEGDTDWTNVSGQHARIDLLEADAFAATVASCNTKYPEQAKWRDRYLDIYLKRIDYPGVRRRAEEAMRASDDAVFVHLGRMMADPGEDTRDWSQEQCDAYVRSVPSGRLYANRKKND